MKSKSTLLLSLVLVMLLFTNTHLIPSTSIEILEENAVINPYLNGIFPSRIPCLGMENSISNCTEQEPPALLSQTGVFTDLINLTPVEGLLSYDLNQPLWTDGALKKRWIALPSDGIRDSAAEQIQFSATSNWSFPVGTVLVKHFEMQLDKNDPASIKKLETRFLIFTEDNRVYGVTYKWNEAGTEANLLVIGESENLQVEAVDGTIGQQIYDYPSRLQCLNCHNANAGRALGLKTWQLNKTWTYTDGTTANQLNHWNSLSMFSNPFSASEQENFLRAVPIDDESASLAMRVRSYLDSNCSHCHYPSSSNGDFDARFPTPMDAKNLIYGYQVEEFQYVPQGYVIKPKDPEQSELWVRDNSAGIPIKSMPPIAKNVVDETYINVLTDYINSLEIDCLEEGCSCSDGIKNGNETGVDCGGVDCVPCTSQQADCEAPNNLNSSNTTRQVTLTWAANIQAKDYSVQGRPIGSSKWRTATVKNTQITANVRPNTDYEWRVRSNCEEERSEWSELAFFSTHTASANALANRSETIVNWSDINLELYPIPSQSTINIESDHAFHQLKIFDINAQLIRTVHWGNPIHQTTLSIEELEAGSYFIQVQSDEDSETLRFLKI